jgi:hypothetical protein
MNNINMFFNSSFVTNILSPFTNEIKKIPVDLSTGIINEN